MFKVILLKIIRALFSLIKIFPLKENQFFFLSYQGRQFSCNPRAVYLYLESNSTGKVFVWGINDSALVLPSLNNKLICVKPKTFRYYVALIRSKYVISNIQLPSFLPKKKGAIWINTWHGGGAFKLVEYHSSGMYSKMTRNIQSKNTDFYISSSRKFTEIMSKSTSISEKKFLGIGMPRNDVFFLGEQERNRIRSKVCKGFSIPNEKIIVLYAPTYRGDVTSAHFNMELDLGLLKNSIEKKFNRTVSFLIRSHHSVKNKNSELKSDVLDGTSYDDMQELLVAADILITDYSSCIYDYALSFKPGFLFVPDLKEYEEQRGLYSSISEWPFDFAENNVELAELIMNYDPNKAKMKISDYLSRLGAYDSGSATETLVRIIGQQNNTIGNGGNNE